MPKQNLWTREELILALNLYLKLPFGRMHPRTSEVIHLAKIINRSPNSVSIRLANYASVDPFHQERGIKGLIGGIRQVKPIWEEFLNDRENLLFEGERLLAQYQHQSLEEKFEEVFIETKDLKGEDKLRTVKTRVNQSVFRQIVIINYKGKCAITGIDIPDLLVASHIIPWSVNEKERINPENGICLSPLYDRAFDKGYIGITPNYKIELSPKLLEHYSKDYYEKHFRFLPFIDLSLPEKYYPKKEFLEYHRDSIFKS